MTSCIDRNEIFAYSLMKEYMMNENTEIAFYNFNRNKRELSMILPASYSMEHVMLVCNKFDGDRNILKWEINEIWNRSLKGDNMCINLQ